MAIPILDKVISLADTIVGGVVKRILPREKMSEGDAAQVELELKRGLREALQNSEDHFRSFVIEHTGAAKDMPRSIQILRGSVRPVITYYAMFLFSMGVWNNWDQETLVMIFKLNLITLTFWFGSKMVERSGIAQAFISRKKNDGSPS